MKNVFAKFGSLSDIDRAHLIIEHHQELDKYSKQKKDFLEKLPVRRMPDYEEYQKKFEKKSNKRANPDEVTESPAKIIKLEVESDIEGLNNTELQDETVNFSLDESNINDSVILQSPNETIESFISKYPILHEKYVKLLNLNKNENLI